MLVAPLPLNVYGACTFVFIYSFVKSINHALYITHTYTENNLMHHHTHMWAITWKKKTKHVPPLPLYGIIGAEIVVLDSSDAKLYESTRVHHICISQRRETKHLDLSNNGHTFPF